MIISFTGTREGMTPKQLEVVRAIILERKPDCVSHGDCIGSDEQFHELAVLAGVNGVIIRPGLNWRGESPTRAHCHLRDINRRMDVKLHVHEPEQYLARDRKIVLDGGLLLATPEGFEEQKRGSGTWATVRTARRLYKPVQIIYPDGTKGGYDPPPSLAS